MTIKPLSAFLDGIGAVHEGNTLHVRLEAGTDLAEAAETPGVVFADGVGVGSVTQAILYAEGESRALLVNLKTGETEELEIPPDSEGEA